MLDELPNAPPRLVDRLVNYVVKGDNESVLADLASLKNTHLAVPLVSLNHRHVVKASLQDRALLVEPVSILRPGNSDVPVFHLAFDSLPQTSAVAATATETTDVSDDDQIEETDAREIVETGLPPRGSLHHVLSEMNRYSCKSALLDSSLQSGHRTIALILS